MIPLPLLVTFVVFAFGCVKIEPTLAGVCRVLELRSNRLLPSYLVQTKG